MSLFNTSSRACDFRCDKVHNECVHPCGPCRHKHLPIVRASRIIIAVWYLSSYFFHSRWARHVQLFMDSSDAFSASSVITLIATFDDTEFDGEKADNNRDQQSIENYRSMVCTPFEGKRHFPSHWYHPTDESANIITARQSRGCTGGRSDRLFHSEN